MPQKFWLFLYSNGNILGSCLGILGMLLFFIGFIDKGWPLIVIGLYGVGYLAIPRQPQWGLTLSHTLQGEQLKSALDKLIKQVKSHMSTEIHTLLLQLQENLNHLIDSSTKTQMSNQLNHFIQQTVTEYLPYAIERYINLPPMYRKLHAVKGTVTAQELLRKQLLLLKDESQKVIDQVHQQDIQSMQVHLNFLEEKFKEVDLLG